MPAGCVFPVYAAFSCKNAAQLACMSITETLDCTSVFAADDSLKWDYFSAGPTQKPQIDAVSNPEGFFGTTEFGFSKKNEVFVGAFPVLALMTPYVRLIFQ